MELTEVLSRIFRRHRLLIVTLVLLGLGIGLALHWGDEPKYRGTARLVVTASDPSTSSEAAAVVDAVRALATGPALVRDALASIGVQRDAGQVAADDIDVRGLGSSGVVELRVTDRDPQVALRLTAAIGNAVVAQRSANASDAIRHQVAALRTSITRLQARIDALDERLETVTAEAGSFDPSVAERAVAQGQQLLAQRAGLTDQLNVLISNQQNLMGQLAEQAPAAMVDPPQGPAQRVSPSRWPDIALGGLLGLVLGVAFAAALETVRPTVVGRAAIARLLHAPVLGEVRRSGTGWNGDDVLELASHIGLASVGHDVKRVDLISTSAQIDLPRLASAVGAELTNFRIEVINPHTIVSHVVSGDDADAAALVGRGRRPAPQRGLVLVIPDAVKLADVDPVRDFLAVSGWPLLGVVIAQQHIGPLSIVRRDSARSATTTLTSEESA